MEAESAGGAESKERGRCDERYVTHTESCAVVQKLQLCNGRWASLLHQSGPL